MLAPDSMDGCPGPLITTTAGCRQSTLVLRHLALLLPHPPKTVPLTRAPLTPFFLLAWYYIPAYIPKPLSPFPKILSTPPLFRLDRPITMTDTASYDYTQSVAALLRQGTAAAHENAENSEGAALIIRGELEKVEYIRFLIMLYHVYKSVTVHSQQHDFLYTDIYVTQHS